MRDYNDNKFDQSLVEQLSEVMPSQEEITNTNPWSKPMSLIIWGSVLTIINLNFLYLQYLLPTIGTVFLFLGYRSFRNENKWFRITWILSIVKLILQLFGMICITTPMIDTYDNKVMGVVFVTFNIIILMIFRKALHTVFKKSNKKPLGDPLLLASVWMVILFFMALVPDYFGWIAMIAMLILYILILRSLFQISKYMDGVGYRLTNAPVKICNLLILILYIVLTIVIVVVCCVFSNHLKVEGRKYSQPQMSEARETLIKKGFPKEILQYLKDKDVQPLSKAIKVATYTETMGYNRKKVTYTSGTETTVLGDKNIESMTIYVELENKELYVMQYFQWEGEKAYWQDVITIDTDVAAIDIQLIDSGLIYDQGAVTYVAPYPRLEGKKATFNNFPFGWQTDRNYRIYGALNYPFGSNNQRGYVLYHYSLPLDYLCTFSILNITHNTHPFAIPYADIEEKMLSGVYSFNKNTQQSYKMYELCVKE